MTNPENKKFLPSPENPNNGFSIDVRNADRVFGLLNTKQFQQGFDFLDGNDHCLDELCFVKVKDNITSNIDISVMGLNNESDAPYQEYNLCFYLDRQCRIGNRQEYSAPLDDSKRLLTQARIEEIRKKMLQYQISPEYLRDEKGFQYLKIKLNNKSFIISLGFDNDGDMSRYYGKDLPQKKFQHLHSYIVREDSGSLGLHDNYTPLTTKEDFETTLRNFAKIQEIFVKAFYFSFDEKEPNIKLTIDYPTIGGIPDIGFCQITGTIRRYNIPESEENIKVISKEVAYYSGILKQSSRKLQKGELSNDKPSKIGFDSIAGQARAVAEAKKLVLAINHPDIFQKRGVKTPKGILFYGPKGTGKTLIAKAIASEVNAALIEVSCADIDTKWYGESGQNIQAVFDRANEVTNTGKKAIILFDEIDAIAPPRIDAYEASKKTVSIILQNLDGFRSNPNVLIIGTTNLPENIDSALKRPGRIDKIILVDLPDINDRKAIIELYVAKAKENALEPNGLFSLELNIQTIAEITEGMSGADLANIINLTLETKTVLESEGIKWVPITNEDIERTLKDFNLEKKEKARIGFK